MWRPSQNNFGSVLRRERLDSMVEDGSDECHPTATDVKERCQAIGKILLESQGLSLLGLPYCLLIARISNEKPSLRTALLC